MPVKSAVLLRLAGQGAKTQTFVARARCPRREAEGESLRQGRVAGSGHHEFMEAAGEKRQRIAIRFRRSLVSESGRRTDNLLEPMRRSREASKVDHWMFVLFLFYKQNSAHVSSVPPILLGSRSFLICRSLPCFTNRSGASFVAAPAMRSIFDGRAMGDDADHPASGAHHLRQAPPTPIRPAPQGAPGRKRLGIPNVWRLWNLFLFRTHNEHPHRN